MTFQELNKYADTLEMEGMAADFQSPDAKALNPAEILGKICDVYHKVKPFFDFLTRMWFIPKKWKTAILTYTAIVESVCPADPIPEE